MNSTKLSQSQLLAIAAKAIARQRGIALTDAQHIAFDTAQRIERGEQPKPPTLRELSQLVAERYRMPLADAQAAVLRCSERALVERVANARGIDTEDAERVVIAARDAGLTTALVDEIEARRATSPKRAR